MEIDYYAEWTMIIIIMPMLENSQSDDNAHIAAVRPPTPLLCPTLPLSISDLQHCPNIYELSRR